MKPWRRRGRGRPGPGTAGARGDPVEAYLDRLLGELRVGPAQARRILTEVEGHLTDAVDAGMAEGLSVADAQARAIERFGSPAGVARRFRSTAPGLFSVPALGQVAMALALVGGIGLVAVGVSGAVAGGMGAVWGRHFVAGDVAGVTYTPTRCADFLEYHPEARSCDQAATAHHFDEVVSYRLATGVLGLLVLAGRAVGRRTRPVARLLRLDDGTGFLPDGFVPTAGAALFGVAAAGLLFLGLGQLVGGDTGGAGGYLSGGLVAAVVGGAFLVELHRSIAVRSAVALDGD